MRTATLFNVKVVRSQDTCFRASETSKRWFYPSKENAAADASQLFNNSDSWFSNACIKEKPPSPAVSPSLTSSSGSRKDYWSNAETFKTIQDEVMLAQQQQQQQQQQQLQLLYQQQQIQQYLLQQQQKIPPGNLLLLQHQKHSLDSSGMLQYHNTGVASEVRSNSFSVAYHAPVIPPVFTSLHTSLPAPSQIPSVPFNHTVAISPIPSAVPVSVQPIQSPYFTSLSNSLPIALSQTPGSSSQPRSPLPSLNPSPTPVVQVQHYVPPMPTTQLLGESDFDPFNLFASSFRQSATTSTTPAVIATPPLQKQSNLISVLAPTHFSEGTPTTLPSYPSSGNKPIPMKIDPSTTSGVSAFVPLQSPPGNVSSKIAHRRSPSIPTQAQLNKDFSFPVHTPTATNSKSNPEIANSDTKNDSARASPSLQTPPQPAPTRKRSNSVTGPIPSAFIPVAITSTPDSSPSKQRSISPPPVLGNPRISPEDINLQQSTPKPIPFPTSNSSTTELPHTSTLSQSPKASSSPPSLLLLPQTPANSSIPQKQPTKVPTPAAPQTPASLDTKTPVKLVPPPMLSGVTRKQQLQQPALKKMADKPDVHKKISIREEVNRLRKENELRRTATNVRFPTSVPQTTNTTTTTPSVGIGNAPTAAVNNTVSFANFPAWSEVECPICHFSFPSEQVLAVHVDDWHSTKSELVSPSALFEVPQRNADQHPHIQSQLSSTQITTPAPKTHSEQPPTHSHAATSPNSSAPTQQARHPEQTPVRTPEHAPVQLHQIVETKPLHIHNPTQQLQATHPQLKPSGVEKKTISDSVPQKNVPSPADNKTSQPAQHTPSPTSSPPVELQSKPISPVKMVTQPPSQPPLLLPDGEPIPVDLSFKQLSSGTGHHSSIDLLSDDIKSTSSLAPVQVDKRSKTPDETSHTPKSAAAVKGKSQPNSPRKDDSTTSVASRASPASPPSTTTLVDLSGAVAPATQGNIFRDISVVPLKPKAIKPARNLTREEAAAILQARWRGKKIRRWYKIEVMRRRVVRELYTTEVTYVDTISKIISIFVTPLRKSLEAGRPIISVDDIFQIFSQLEGILTNNKKVLNLLKDTVDHWHVGSLIGDILLKNLATPQMLELYSNYTTSFPVVFDYFMQLQERNAGFKKFVEASERQFWDDSHSGNTYQSLAILPVQRAPRYMLLLKALKDWTPDGHPDRTNVELTLVELEGLCRALNTKQGAEENERARVKTLVTIGSKIKPKLKELTSSPDRFFVREGDFGFVDVARNCALRKRHFFLMNDLLIVTKEVVHFHKTKYALRNVISIADARVKDMTDAQAAALRKDLHDAFEIHTSDRSLLFYCHSDAEKELLTTFLRQQNINLQQQQQVQQSQQQPVLSQRH
ncbi:rho guanine nucleotide exchange factor 17 [Pelomyxa schiedti]|nr:rho guanine nucleotide exchange factor 17 [Pelomyxa schiedti]